MKILHVTPTYFPARRYGGPIYSVHGLCSALVELGHDVHVYTTSVDGSGDSDVPHGCPVELDGVQVWYFPSKRLRRLYFSPPMMQMLLLHIKYFDVIHLHSVFLWPTWAAARVARQVGVPYVLAPKGMLVKELIRRKSWLLKNFWIRFIEKKNIEQAAVVHLTSQKEAEELVKFSFQLPETIIYPHGIDAAEDWSENDLSDDVRAVIENKKYVLFFGRLNWKKGIDRLIRAWKDVSGVQLIVAGNDEEEYLPELQTLARIEGVSNQVAFLPRSITGADKEALFAGARLFALPSYSENFGITVLEAMVRGVPVAVTEDVGAVDIVVESGGGKVISEDNLAAIFSTLFLDEESLKIMGEKGRRWVQNKYTWNKIATAMIACYQEIAFDA